MKTIRMKTTMAGPEGTAVSGATVTVSDELADALIRGGYAELMRPATVSVVETASVEAPEQAVGSGGRRKKG